MNKFSYYNKEFINLQFFQLLNGAFSHLLHDLENGKKKNSGPGKMPEPLLRKYNYRIKSNSYTYKLANS